MGIRVARALMVLGFLLQCNMVLAQDIMPYLPTLTPEEKAELKRGRENNPQTMDVTVTPELRAAIADAEAAGKNSTNAAELGDRFNKMICEKVRTDVLHTSTGYKFIEDRARACVDDVNLTRNLGLLDPPQPAAPGETAISPEHKAFLACMARECETRLLVKLFAPSGGGK